MVTAQYVVAPPLTRAYLKLYHNIPYHKLVDGDVLLYDVEH